MLREKYNSLTKKRGYLYLRETVYVRDKRSLKRTPCKLCDGKATKQRGKYSQKIDTYCGKIEEIRIKHIITFQDYLKKEKIEYIEFKQISNYEQIIDKFVDYLLYIYEIDKDLFFSKKKRVYAVNYGYLSTQTINWLKSFRIRKGYNYETELERFSYRCQDTGIFDEDIISLLFSKIMPKDSLINTDIEDKNSELLKIKVKSLREFIRKG